MKMTEEKLKRVTVATTVGAVLLAIVLLFVLVFQLISIKVEKDKLAELDAAIVEYKRLIDEGTEELDARSEYWWIVKRARELGYRFDGDKIYK